MASKKYHFVYETVCKETGKFYRGKHSTNDLDDGYIGSGVWITRGKRKNGAKQYARTILEFCSEENLSEREIALIAEVYDDPNCMNLMEGGIGGPGLNSDQAKALWENEEYRSLQSENLKALWQRPEYREARAKKVGAQLTDRWKDPEYREKVVGKLKGRKKSEETKAKMSAARKAVAARKRLEKEQ